MSTPSCPGCGSRIDLMRRTPDLVAAYPCGCWLTPGQAEAIAERHRAARQTGEAR
ncbi:hypothetical protein ACGFIY_21245 [Micromonospora chersina]|uniref:hypothetical protein n=1 Tax=Micromonospora chersina TaxID=47854 RepID=UPI00371B6E93